MKFDVTITQKQVYLVQRVEATTEDEAMSIAMELYYRNPNGYFSYGDKDVEVTESETDE